MTQRWQRALLMPSWIRWLPCAFVYLTVVPERQPFRRSVWDGIVPWEDAVWCDPGDVEEWVARARRQHSRREADLAELQAREHYDWMVSIRAARIELFGQMCQRLDLPLPHTVKELLSCLAGFGLIDLDHAGGGDPWVRLRLDRDPLAVLPLSDEERALETRAQRDDRAVLVAIAIRRLAERGGRRWRRRVVVTSHGELATDAGVTVEQVDQSLGDLKRIADLSIERSPTDALRLTMAWPDFRRRFPFSELPAPEHAG